MARPDRMGRPFVAWISIRIEEFTAGMSRMESVRGARKPESENMSSF